MIRELQERDFEDLLRLFESVAGERLWLGTEPGFDRDGYRQGWRNILEGKRGAAFVAIEKGHLAGYIGLHPHDEYGYVLGMLVHGAYRGRGLGRALLDRGIDWARQRGLRDISLLVFPHNAPAITLYRRAGFEQRAYYSNDVTRATGEVWDTILMTKVLD